MRAPQHEDDYEGIWIFLWFFSMSELEDVFPSAEVTSWRQHDVIHIIWRQKEKSMHKIHIGWNTTVGKKWNDSW